jgi:hypothetical protein
MKKFESLGRSLSKEEQKSIAGAGNSVPVCLGLDADCNDNVQCCSNNCASVGSSSSTGKACKTST